MAVLAIGPHLVERQGNYENLQGGKALLLRLSFLCVCGSEDPMLWVSETLVGNSGPWTLVHFVYFGGV